MQNKPLLYFGPGFLFFSQSEKNLLRRRFLCIDQNCFPVFNPSPRLHHLKQDLRNSFHWLQTGTPSNTHPSTPALPLLSMGLGPTQSLKTSFRAASSMQIPHCLHPSDSLCSATRKDGLCAAPGVLAPGATSGGLSCRLILGWVQAVCLAALARLQPTFPRNPHFGISRQHHQLKLRISCPWALRGTRLSAALVEQLPQFPLCEMRCHLSATLVSSIFGPCCWLPRPRSF